MHNYRIRKEKLEDYREVEELTRKAFWNLNVPGCNEHYLAHIMRSHCDFIPELDLVLEGHDCIIGSVMYAKSWLIDEDGVEKDILTFGPVSILSEYQRKGYGKALLEASFTKAVELGYDTIVIFGNPDNYIGRGFKSCKKYDVSLENGIFPAAMLVKELKPGVLEGKRWTYRDSDVYNINEQDAEIFDQKFEKREKEYRTSQEEFYIHSHSRIL